MLWQDMQSAWTNTNMFFVMMGYTNPARYLNMSSFLDVLVSGRIGITHCNIFHPCIAHDVSHDAKLALMVQVHKGFHGRRLFAPVRSTHESSLLKVRSSNLG